MARHGRIYSQHSIGCGCIVCQQDMVSVHHASTTACQTRGIVQLPMRLPEGAFDVALLSSCPFSLVVGILACTSLALAGLEEGVLAETAHGFLCR